MKIAMMRATKWHRELITDFSPDCARLCKAKMMGIRRRATAYDAGLARDKLAMLRITQSDRLCRDGTFCKRAPRRAGIFRAISGHLCLGGTLRPSIMGFRIIELGEREREG